MVNSETIIFLIPSQQSVNSEEVQKVLRLVQHIKHIF